MIVCAECNDELWNLKDAREIGDVKSHLITSHELFNYNYSHSAKISFVEALSVIL